jgi:hypothetical protein
MNLLTAQIIVLIIVAVIIGAIEEAVNRYRARQGWKRRRAEADERRAGRYHYSRQCRPNRYPFHGSK